MHEYFLIQLKFLKQWSFSSSNDHEASTSSLVKNKDNIQIQFGSFLATQNEEPIIQDSPRISLMKKYLREAELEEEHNQACLNLGGFKCPINVPYPALPQCFLNSAFKYAPAHSLWPPNLSAQHKDYLAQASYSEEEITTLANNWAVLCARYLQWGHQKIDCPAILICINCSTPDHKASKCPAGIPL